MSVILMGRVQIVDAAETEKDTKGKGKLFEGERKVMGDCWSDKLDE